MNEIEKYRNLHQLTSIFASFRKRNLKLYSRQNRKEQIHWIAIKKFSAFCILRCEWKEKRFPFQEVIKSQIWNFLFWKFIIPFWFLLGNSIRFSSKEISFFNAITFSCSFLPQCSCLCNSIFPLQRSIQCNVVPYLPHRLEDYVYAHKISFFWKKAQLFLTILLSAKKNIKFPLIISICHNFELFLSIFSFHLAEYNCIALWLSFREK